MPSEYDDQNLARTLTEQGSVRRRHGDAQGHVTSLAAEVLQRVARRAAELREARDLAAVKAAALTLSSGTEADAFAALESLDDPLRELDWFLSERLGPIAREIGALWNAGAVTYQAATTGASRIYSYLRYRRRPAAMPDHGLRKSATFALVPGDMHTLAISAAADVFRARGWDITLLIGYTNEELCEHFKGSTDRIFGFAAGSSQSLEQLGRLVVSVTDARPEASVFVAGQITDDPSTVLVLPGIDFRDVELEATCNWFEAHTPPTST
jgi:methanogenic corrinoid protein MtbC1